MNTELMQLLTKERDTCLRLIRETRNKISELPDYDQAGRSELQATLNEQKGKYDNLCVSLKRNATNR